jgi:hypothetical protein
MSSVTTRATLLSGVVPEGRGFAARKEQDQGHGFSLSRVVFPAVTGAQITSGGAIMTFMSADEANKTRVIGFETKVAFVLLT